MTEQHQLKIAVNDGYLRRLQEARAAGLVTDMSGLGKLALSHAMDHGQDVTTALLRNGHGPAPAGQEAVDLEQLAAELLAGLAPIEQRFAAGVQDVKRRIIQATAVVAGLLLLLAVGMALYLRPSTSTG